jgi:hypothetical protein
MSGEFFKKLRTVAWSFWVARRRGYLPKRYRRHERRSWRFPHVGNQGLNGTFEVPNHLKLATPLARREHRVQLWADAVLRAIAGESAQHLM